MHLSFEGKIGCFGEVFDRFKTNAKGVAHLIRSFVSRFSASSVHGGNSCYYRHCFRQMFSFPTSAVLRTALWIEAVCTAIELQEGSGFFAYVLPSISFSQSIPGQTACKCLHEENHPSSCAAPLKLLSLCKFVRFCLIDLLEAHRKCIFCDLRSRLN